MLNSDAAEFGGRNRRPKSYEYTVQLSNCDYVDHDIYVNVPSRVAIVLKLVT